MKVLLTRPAAQAGEWVQGLRARGIDALALPLIAIAPADDASPVRAAWATLSEQRLLVFVSPNAVEHFFALRPAGAAWPASTLAGATGPGTSERLLRQGIPRAMLVEPRADAAQFDSEALWAELEHRDWREARVTIVRGDGGRDWLSDKLRERAAVVNPVSAYRRIAPSFSVAEQALFDAAIAQPALHLWFFSSSEAIDHLEAIASGARWQLARAITTHPRIESRARRAGFGDVRLARPELDAVAACIQSWRPRDLGLTAIPKQ